MQLGVARATAWPQPGVTNSCKPVRGWCTQTGPGGRANPVLVLLQFAVYSSGCSQGDLTPPADPGADVTGAFDGVGR
jgi:hypothetical protein